MKIQPERFTKVWLINSNEEGLSLFIQQKCPFALMHNSLFFWGGVAFSATKMTSFLSQTMLCPFCISWFHDDTMCGIG